MPIQEMFQASEIERLIGIPAWRLSKFVESPGYRIKPSLRRTTGRGAPRLYSLDDLLGIALAWWLFQAGLRSKVIGRAIRTKGLIESLREARSGDSQTARDRYLVIRREIGVAGDPPQEVRVALLAEVTRELESTEGHSIGVIPLGGLLTNVWKGLEKP